MGVVLLEVSDSVQEAYEEAERATAAVMREYPCTDREARGLNETILINGMRDRIITLATLLARAGCKSGDLYAGLMRAYVRLGEEADKLVSSVKREAGLDD